VEVTATDVPNYYRTFIWSIDTHNKGE